LARKKAEAAPKKKAARPKLGFLDHFLVLLEHFLSYFELLFVYFRKKFNQSVQRTVVLLILLSYATFLLLSSTGFFVHAGYMSLLRFFDGDMVLSSLSMGTGLLVLSLLALYVFLKKIVF
jgi:hypothetical protein